MARKRKSGPPWRLRLLAGVLFASLAGAMWFWWDMRGWTPDRGQFPEQGVAVSEESGRVSFEVVRALGGKFAFLVASRGAGDKDSSFVRNVRAARRAGLKVGAVHQFDPCVPADGQTANFVTMVARNERMLAPVIALDQTAHSCSKKISEAAVESELMTLINQIEFHAGKPVILKLSKRFEQTYHTAELIERDLWLSRNRFKPDYTLRPWLLWSANDGLVSDAAEEPIEWVVVQN